RGHKMPNSNERIVPVTAPTANCTAITTDQRRAIFSAMGSLRQIPIPSIRSVSVGIATPSGTTRMWVASVNAIWMRLGSSASRATESGSDVVFAVLGPGDALGELGALEEGASRSADARALSEAECLVIHRPALVRFLTAHPAAMWGVVNVLTSYIRTKDEAFVDLAVRDIPGRVARKLLDLAGTQSTFALSQSTLAGPVGAS